MLYFNDQWVIVVLMLGVGIYFWMCVVCDVQYCGSGMNFLLLLGMVLKWLVFQLCLVCLMCFFELDMKFYQRWCGLFSGLLLNSIVFIGVFVCRWLCVLVLGMIRCCVGMFMLFNCVLFLRMYNVCLWWLLLMLIFVFGFRLIVILSVLVNIFIGDFLLQVWLVIICSQVFLWCCLGRVVVVW